MSRQLTALKVVAMCLGKARQDALCYIYEEYEVIIIYINKTLGYVACMCIIALYQIQPIS